MKQIINNQKEINKSQSEQINEYEIRIQLLTEEYQDYIKNINKKDDLIKQFKLNKINTEANIDNHTSNCKIVQDITLNQGKNNIVTQNNSKNKIERMQIVMLESSIAKLNIKPDFREFNDIMSDDSLCKKVFESLKNNDNIIE